ncbi:hypothetical protein Acr_10g0001660 [Actinidia rufa]|uniref:Uncharacterized protein n=1 Tax=Actinidia rufa TaxID=165716 RepID=A0A7J0F823_9ERIC|nr:hypothetical protein Acr_10g0001660 [Actinidia rufa]
MAILVVAIEGDGGDGYAAKKGKRPSKWSRPQRFLTVEALKVSSTSVIVEGTHHPLLFSYADVDLDDDLNKDNDDDWSSIQVGFV